MRPYLDNFSSFTKWYVKAQDTSMVVRRSTSTLLSSPIRLIIIGVVVVGSSYTYSPLISKFFLLVEKWRHWCLHKGFIQIRRSLHSRNKFDYVSSCSTCEHSSSPKSRYPLLSTQNAMVSAPSLPLKRRPRTDVASSCQRIGSHQFQTSPWTWISIPSYLCQSSVGCRLLTPILDRQTPCTCIPARARGRQCTPRVPYCSIRCRSYSAWCWGLTILLKLTVLCRNA